ncbi:MAG: LptF/LptG family permease [Endomicrobia bacterium]|nr:LptF/LptG family permease [Endomicrobiia bacterium]MCL2506754.1 LptF/LptG family permease [Endomicrobiia bacterium]
MKILYFYVAKQFSRIFFFTAFAFGFIVLISELFRQISFYMEYKTGLFIIAQHLFSNIPWWIIQVLPVATLLALLFSLGDLAKRNEITAMKAAGINLWKIITLLMIAGFIIGLADFGAREFIVPKTTYFNEVVKKEKIQKEEIHVKTEFSNLIVSLQNHSRLSVGYLNTKEKIMKDVIIERYSDDFILERLVLAPEGVWKDNTWTLSNGVIRDFDKDSWNELYFKEYDSGINLKPEDIALKKMRYEMMDTHAFKKYIRQLRIFGQTALKERIALNIRYASVFSHLIVMMIGIPFALGLGNKFGKILSFTLALGAAFVYWGVQAITQSLGENYILSPFMAAWLPNFIFFAIGIYLLIKVKK